MITNDVFLLWDNSRAEHGENATLVDVYADRDHAKTDAVKLNDDADCDTDSPLFDVETRELKQPRPGA